MTRAVCTICGRPNFGQGYCQKHWRAAMAAGTITTKNRQKVCGFDGCDRAHHCKGLCRAHYDQHLAGAELTPIGVRKTRVARGCDFPECDRPHAGKGWCKEHLRQIARGNGMHPIGKFPRTAKSTTDNLRRKHRKTDGTSKPRTPKPESNLPPGWDRVAPKTVHAKPNGSDIPMAGSVYIAPGLLIGARRVLEQHDALDLAEMLGLVAA